MSETPASQNPIKEFVGLTLIVIGVLWMAASGLCSLGLVALAIPQAPNVSEILGLLPMVLIIGGFSVGLGFVFYVVGRALRPGS